jgi:hypothetical protein
LFVVSMIDVVPASVTPVLESPIDTVAPAERISPLSVTALGAVAVSPPVKVSVSAAASPNASVPVFANDTLLVTAVPPPRMSRS